MSGTLCRQPQNRTAEPEKSKTRQGQTGLTPQIKRGYHGLLSNLQK